MAYRELGQGWGGLWAAVFPPLALGVPVLLLGLWLNRWLTPGGLLLQSAALLVCSLLAYGLLVKLFLPRVLGELWSHFKARRSQPANPDLQP